MGYFSELHASIYSKSEGYPQRIGRDYEEYVFIVVKNEIMARGVINFTKSTNVAVFDNPKDALNHQNYLKVNNQYPDTTFQIEEFLLNA